MSETDPWKVAKSTIRARIADYSVALLGHSSGSQQAKENAQTAIDVAIDAARAAEAAQHQQEIAAKDEMIGRWTQTGLTLMKFFAAFPVMNESDMPEFLWRAVPTLIRSTRQAAAKAEARLAAVEAERDMLNGALEAAPDAGILSRTIDNLAAERDRLAEAERLATVGTVRSLAARLEQAEETRTAAQAEATRQTDRARQAFEDLKMERQIVEHARTEAAGARMDADAWCREAERLTRERDAFKAACEAWKNQAEA